MPRDTSHRAMRTAAGASSPFHPQLGRTARIVLAALEEHRRISHNIWMLSVSSSAAMACTFGPAGAAEVDLILIPWYEDDGPAAVPALDAATGGEIARALSTREFQAKPYELFIAAIADKSWRTRRVALIGGGGRPEIGRRIRSEMAPAGGAAGRHRPLAGAAALRRR